jgi:hypothetical protein
MAYSSNMNGKTQTIKKAFAQKKSTAPQIG